jgi:biotin carboxylase
MGDDQPWDQLRAFEPDGVVTFAEDLLDDATKIASHLGLPHSPTVTSTELCDKRWQRARLRSAGVEHIRSVPLNGPQDWPDALRSVGLPLVLKPAHGTGSFAVKLVTTEAEGLTGVEGFFAQWPGRALLAEEYLVGVDNLPYGDYVSVETLVAGGKIQHLGVTGKLPPVPPFRETGQYHPSGLDEPTQRQALDLASRVIEALGITQCAVHTEMKLTADGPRVIEVNGRLGGYIGELYSRVLGCDVIELVTRLACGQPVTVPEPDTRLHFNYPHQPPLGATRLLAVDGIREAKRHPAVTGYAKIAAVGTRLPTDGSTFDLDLLSGTVSSREELLPALAEIQSCLKYSFDMPGGTRVLTGLELDRRSI